MAVICTVTSQYQEGLLQVCHQRTSPWAAGKVEIACTTCRLSWRMLQRHHFPCRVGKKHIEISKSLKPVTKNIQIQYLETYFNRQIMPQIWICLNILSSCTRWFITVFRSEIAIIGLPICTIFINFQTNPYVSCLKHEIYIDLWDMVPQSSGIPNILGITYPYFHAGWNTT